MSYSIYDIDDDYVLGDRLFENIRLVEEEELLTWGGMNDSD
jgi:hypothetical protein